MQQGHAGGADPCAAGYDDAARADTCTNADSNANANSATHNLGGDAE